ncbi:unnamed protein product [Closterium sp. NIES-65]|nr:unnamed protein product [Closterium sp. NIES-65]
MGEVEETNYRPGNGLTRRVQGVGEGLEGVTLPSPFAAEMTEAEADALVNNHRALYQQALKRRETIASSVGKTKCVHTLSGVPVPQKKSRAAKSGGQKGKRRRKAGATTGSQADLPAPASTEEELVTDGLLGLPLPASSQQQQQTVTNLNPLPAGSQQQLLASSLPNRPRPVKALDTFTWLITDAPVECMEFFPTFEVFQPHLITKYQLCGVNRDEYFYATGGRIEFEKLVMKVIKTKRSNTHKKVRFYAWGAGGLVDESKWPLLAVEQIIPSKKRTEEKWLEEFRHVRALVQLQEAWRAWAGNSNATTACSAWAGVTCSPNGAVVALDSKAFTMDPPPTGTIPAAITDLAALQYLSVRASPSLCPLPSALSPSRSLSSCLHHRAFFSSFAHPIPGLRSSFSHSIPPCALLPQYSALYFLLPPLPFHASPANSLDLTIHPFPPSLPLPTPSPTSLFLPIPCSRI